MIRACILWLDRASAQRFLGGRQTALVAVPASFGSAPSRDCTRPKDGRTSQRARRRVLRSRFLFLCRTPFELVAIGSLGNLSPNDSDYLRWKKQNVGSLPFSTAMKKLRGVTNAHVQALIFKPKGWLETLYEALCAYTHSRPDSSDGEMWRSNGPIYVGAVFNRVFKLQVSTYAACHVLTKVGRPDKAEPLRASFFFSSPPAVALMALSARKSLVHGANVRSIINVTI
jgi:hypothetical protein